MKSLEIKSWLESEMANLPDRISGEEGYRFMFRLVSRIVKTDRSELIKVLKDWLSLREEPRTMLAVEIVAMYNFVELKSDLENLVEDIKLGKAFKLYYAKLVKQVLSKLKQEKPQTNEK